MGYLWVLGRKSFLLNPSLQYYQHRSLRLELRCDVNTLRGGFWLWDWRIGNFFQQNKNKMNCTFCLFSFPGETTVLLLVAYRRFVCFWIWIRIWIWTRTWTWTTPVMIIVSKITLTPCQMLQQIPQGFKTLLNLFTLRFQTFQARVITNSVH